MQSNTIQLTIPMMLYSGLIGLFGGNERIATGHGRSPWDEDDDFEDDYEDLDEDFADLDGEDF